MARQLPFIFSFLLSFLMALPVFSQQKKSFEVAGTTNEVEISRYTEALRNANIEQYRLPDKQRILLFEDGVKVYLFSLNELGKLYGSWKTADVIIENTDEIYPNRFHILPSGIINEMIPIVPVKGKK